MPWAAACFPVDGGQPLASTLGTPGAAGSRTAAGLRRFGAGAMGAGGHHGQQAQCAACGCNGLKFQPPCLGEITPSGEGYATDGSKGVSANAVPPLSGSGSGGLEEASDVDDELLEENT